MPQDDATFPPLVQGLFPESSRRDAARLLARGRVEGGTFFRLGVAGRVVAPNGRGHFALLAVDRKGALLAATCGCTPKLLPNQLCMHLGALVLSFSGSGSQGGHLALAGERFERSLWFRIAEELHGQGGKTEFVSRAGVGGQEGPPDISPLGAYEKRLIEVTRTPDEAMLNQRGARTQRQSFEGSDLFLLAKRAFEAVGDDPSSLSVEVADGSVCLVAPVGAISYRLPLTAGAIEALLREAPTFFAEHGLAVQGAAKESLRLTLEADGSLLLVPVYLAGEGTSAEALPRERPGLRRCGRHLVFPETRTLVPLAESRRPFVERSAPIQTGFAFDEVWRPSSVGIPLDRPTRIPADDVAPFLARHRAELAAWPPALLPPELRGAGLAEPDGASLTVHGEEGGRFVISLDFTVGDRVVPFEPLFRSRRERKPLYLVGGMALDPRHARFAWMDSVGSGALRGNGREALLCLAPLEVCRLRSYLPSGHGLSAARGVPPATLERIESLFPETPAAPPGEFGLSLYDFQRTGYAWLWFLYRNGFGGLLCDDMGLGKTHQVMALLAAMRAEAGGAAPAVLVACPASVLPHWEEKMATWLPGFPVTVHHGSGRGPVPEGGGVLVSTYGTLRNDAAALSGRTFDLFVLDEIQSIKNRGTATHEALRTLQAKVAIGLTGTPVENRVEELRALLEFVLPGYLPGEAEFRRGFGKPIEEGDEGARERLRRIARPFVLRRTKGQVLAGLPEKIEDKRHCVMTERQAALHADLLASRGTSLRGTLDRGGAIPYLHVFALLDKLKQLCDHPDLLLPVGSPPSGETSGKWELFVEVLDEALGSGLKVVVFSQYLRMLDRIEAHLAERRAGHAGIRGATADRKAPVERFRDDPACRVFVASLKAAGLGIDLTAASVVIHYDRWWNKAREDQATDRVHRIGQKRGVQVLTLVTKGTVEERIDGLIAAKARLAANLVPEEDPRLFHRFTRDELRALLEP